MTALPSEAAPAVLLVDDRRENLLSLEAILAPERYTLVRADSGEQALHEVLRRDFAVILMDIAMPGIDGFEAAALIKRRPRSAATPIIFVTASIHDIEHIHRGYTAGAVDYLYKPVSAAVVRAKVRVFAEIYSQREQIRRQAEALRERSRQERERLLACVETALQAGEARYHAAYHDAPFGVAVLDRRGHWRRANRWLSAALGYAPGSLPDLLALLAPGPGGEMAALAAALRGEIPTFAGEFALAHRDGHLVWVSLTLSGFVDASEPLVAAVLQDVGARRAEGIYQRCLNAAGEVLLSELNCAHTLPRVAALVAPGMADWCAIDLVDGDRARPAALAHAVPERAEAVAARRAGWLAAEVAGLRAPLLAPHLDDEDAQDQAIAAGWLRARDLTLPCSLVRVPIVAAGELLGAITLGSEQRARRFAAADVRFAASLAHRCAFAVKSARLYEAAQAAVRARDDFISIASHELRTPLTPLRLQLQRLAGTRRRPPLSLPAARRDAIMGGCVRHVARLGALIDNLLDVARLTSGPPRLERAPMDLAELAAAVVARCNDGGIAEDAAQIQLAEAVPARGAWDASRLEQVIVNLLSNALRYGGGRPVTVAVRPRGPWAEVRVRDQGMGIPADQHAAIFARFRRGAGSGAHGGLGLGLYIVKQIVDAHAGKISVESAPGDGATFVLQLPLAAPAGAAAGPPAT